MPSRNPRPGKHLLSYCDRRSGATIQPVANPPTNPIAVASLHIPGTHASLLTIPPLADILLESSLNIRLTEVFLVKTSEHSSTTCRPQERLEDAGLEFFVPSAQRHPSGERLCFAGVRAATGIAPITLQRSTDEADGPYNEISKHTLSTEVDVFAPRYECYGI
ncbi:hypothetical protein B9Z19DRAFT_1121845 [Tuber borchii]|uniref:Uncharacterized protein n=1 Tax=Tuber borchii TaxID=42251 RepID=A0A2T7A218_TUBBO|nr:hypothetical protein B9Z19DRAFT_1121845 [Tuber borchii]